MKTLSATRLYTLSFGFFLGLCVLKFGNPVILDHRIFAPASVGEFIHAPWPLHWANWILLPLAAFGAGLVLKYKYSCQLSPGLWLLPLVWLGWQFVSATQTVDTDLTRATLWQFSGLIGCYFLGIFIFARENLLCWLLAGLLAAFTFCLVRGVDQKCFEYPQSRSELADGERSSWTNFPPEIVTQMKADNIIITTNGLDVVNPVILAKFIKGRVSGTLVYPNALAGIILLLWPVAFALARGATTNLKPSIRLAVLGLTLFLGGAAFFWTGSKLGWLLGLALAGLYLLRQEGSKKYRLAAVFMVLVFGLAIFAIRFHAYFSAGATSAGARLDYWRAAVQTAAAKPVFGSGPGTFQRPYAQLKAPDSEMARLAHNDYLEQFSDSGLAGGLAYLVWVYFTLAATGKNLWRSRDGFSFAIFAGLLAWFLQGFGEFGLYIPALAWPAFTLLGGLVAQKKLSSQSIRD